MKISYLVAYSLVFFSSSAALVLAGTCTCTGNSCTVIQVSTNIPDEDACETFLVKLMMGATRMERRNGVMRIASWVAC